MNIFGENAAAKMLQRRARAHVFSVRPPLGYIKKDETLTIIVTFAAKAAAEANK